jgi:holin-like protein
MPQSPMPAASPAATAAIQPLRGLACLLLLQAAGELLGRAAALPVPGPVIGLLLLLVALRLPALRAPVAAAAQALLAHLSLLFVPVGVGVVAHLSLVGEHGLRLLVVIVLSTWVGMVVTALLARAWLAPREPPQEAP